ncbi:MAG TPA: 3'-5' exonuclease [Longimicrobium sp.]|nr:3'-5' exonuclease [Longimicrobium sp.]
MPDTVLREAALERIADALDSTGAYQVARRFRPRARYAEDDGTPTLTGLFVDVETTGLDSKADAIIQLALVPFEYSPEDGRVFAVGEAQVHLEDPGRPVPPAVTALTGISDRDVAGRRIDDDAVGRLAADAHLVIAHNAAFDRPMMERRLDVFRERPWACSHTEVPWARHGIASAKLEYLLFRHCRAFAEGHRADEDAHAGVHVLATPFRSGERPLALLLAASEKLTVRIWATDAPFGCKAALKARGYRWNPSENGRPRAWYADVDRETYEAEAAWLSAEVYCGTRGRWRRQVFGAMDRFSSRV